MQIEGYDYLFLWVPVCYFIQIGDEQKVRINNAISTIEEETCVRFVNVRERPDLVQKNPHCLQFLPQRDRYMYIYILSKSEFTLPD